MNLRFHFLEKLTWNFEGIEALCLVLVLLVKRLRHFPVSLLVL